MRKIRIFEKLLVSLIAAFCLFVFTTAPFVNAATIYTERFFQYTVENQSITIVRYFGTEETVKIPAAIGGLPVNTIAAGAFAEKTPVKDVWLPDTITTVETNAFPKGVAVHYAEEEPANGSFPPDDTSTTNGSQNVEETYSGKTDTSKNGQDTSKDSSEEQRIDSNNPTDGNGARPTKEPNDESAKGNTGTKPSPTSVAKDVPNGLEEGEGSIEKDENSSGKGSSSDKNGGSSKPTSIDDSSVSIGKNSSGDGSAGKGDKNSSGGTNSGKSSENFSKNDNASENTSEQQKKNGMNESFISDSGNPGSNRSEQATKNGATGEHSFGEASAKKESELSGSEEVTEGKTYDTSSEIQEISGNQSGIQESQNGTTTNDSENNKGHLTNAEAKGIPMWAILLVAAIVLLAAIGGYIWFRKSRGQNK